MFKFFNLKAGVSVLIVLIALLSSVVQGEVRINPDLRGYIKQIYNKSPGYVTIEEDTFMVPSSADIKIGDQSVRLRELEEGMEVIYTLEDKKNKKYPVIKSIDVIVK